MGSELIPKKIHDRYLIDERRHACAILATDFPREFDDILACLKQFELLRSEVAVGGGGKSRIAGRFDDFLSKQRGWEPKATSIAMTVDGIERTLETHEVDLCKGKVAIEVEWNNKDPFFSRDLNAFRLLHELGVISVGVVITRCDELQEIFDSLGWVRDKKGEWQRVGAKYGASTTHWEKLMPRVNAGGGGSCPLLLIGIRRACYRDDIPKTPLVLRKP